MGKTMKYLSENTRLGLELLPFWYYTKQLITSLTLAGTIR